MRLYQKCAEHLKGHLTGEVCLQIAKSVRVSSQGYDAVIVGGSVYMGTIRGKVGLLQAKPQGSATKAAGRFACCYPPKETEGFLESLFPHELLARATKQASWSVDQLACNFVNKSLLPFPVL